MHPIHAHFDAKHRPLAERIAVPIAKFLGTGQYLAVQTLVILIWVAINITVVTLRWDPYPFILLNLVFSTQASYAAPLILLAGSRRDELDRDRADHDHRVLDTMSRQVEALYCQKQSRPERKNNVYSPNAPRRKVRR